MKTGPATTCAALVLLLNTSVLPSQADLLVLGIGPDRRTILRFETATGEHRNSITANTEAFTSLCPGPDGEVFVTSSVLGYGEVLRFQPDGTLSGKFGKDQLRRPTGIALGPEGRVYVIGSTEVSGQVRPQVLMFDARAGEFAGTFIAARPEHTNTWHSPLFSETGDLLICDSGLGILRFDGRTGDAQGALVPVGRGGLSYPAGLTFGPDGALYVSCRDSNAVLRFDAESGSYLGRFVAPAPAGPEGPGAIAFGPDARLYVVCAQGVLRFSGDSGSPLGVFAPAAGPLSSSALLFISHPPRLQIRHTEAGIELSWEPTPENWRLFMELQESPGVWVPVNGEPTRTRAQRALILPLAAPRALFRLQRE